MLRCLAVVLLAVLSFTIASATIKTTAHRAPKAADDLQAMLQFISTFGQCVDPTWREDRPVCHWMDVRCSNGTVTEFICMARFCSGTADFSSLPSGMKRVNLAGNDFQGGINLAQLPPGMTYLNVNGNNFSGSVDLTMLPPGMEKLDLSDNMLSGPVDLSKLPRAMHWLNLDGNKGLCGITKINRDCSSVILPLSCECDLIDKEVQCPPCSMNP